MSDAPSAQNEIVMNCVHDNTARQSSCSSINRNGIKSSMKRLYEASESDIDQTIYEGDLLFTSKNEPTKRRCFGIYSNHDEQPNQPAVIASLNGFEVPLSEYNKAEGLDETRKRRKILRDRIQVVGASKKIHYMKDNKAATADNPVAVIQGVMRMVNNSRENINLLDYLVWDVPDPDVPHVPLKTHKQTVGPNTRKLVIKPLRVDMFTNMSHISEYLIHCGFKPDVFDELQKFKDTDTQGKLNYIDVIDKKLKPVTSDAANMFQKLCKTSSIPFKIIANHYPDAGTDDFKIMNGSITILMIQGILKKDDIYYECQNLLNSIYDNFMEVFERVIGRCLTPGGPGEFIHAVIGAT